MQSIWMDNIEYRVVNNLYAVSRDGKVLRKMRPHQPSLRSDGYLCLRQLLVHRLVAMCWLPNFKQGRGNHVHHINGIKTDNRSENLECLSASSHIKKHAHESGNHGHYIRTEVTRQKLRNFRTGFKDTPETAAKKNAILRAHQKLTPCSYMGIQYPSVSAGARAAGCSPSTFRQRCFSKNFPDFKLN